MIRRIGRSNVNDRQCVSLFANACFHRTKLLGSYCQSSTEHSFVGALMDGAKVDDDTRVVVSLVFRLQVQSFPGQHLSAEEPRFWELI
jgi:hypothetical protein